MKSPIPIAAAAVKAMQVERELARLEAELKRMRPVYRAAMRLWNSRRAAVKPLERQSHGLDCEGFYWIIRDTEPMKAWRRECARAERAKATD